ncbi:MAG: class I SAM-dependent methyltransferase [Promethearchaeota archaeon]|nr:MAG: class I SAM-dependent methyltransferase [Candidatus Lokiarchaeota archaeon]
MIETEMVKKGYNKMALQYYAHRNLSKFDSELEQFSSLLPKNGHILDVGTGIGIPTAKFLAEKGFEVTGIDISETMINEAKKNVPKANFIEMNALEMPFEKNKFDGIISVYTLFHIPRIEHENLFKKFYEILRPKGILMINSGVSESEGRSNFFGVPMFWSNFSPDKTLSLVKKTGFSITFEGVLERGGEIQYWIFAQK